MRNCLTVCIQTQCDPTPDEQTPIEDLPPSAKLTYKTLEYEGALTQKQLAAQTRLPNRTVRYALTRLEEEGYVDERLYLQDARQRQYVLQPEAESEPEP